MLDRDNIKLVSHEKKRFIIASDYDLEEKYSVGEKEVVLIRLC